MKSVLAAPCIPVSMSVWGFQAGGMMNLQAWNTRCRRMLGSEERSAGLLAKVA